MAAKTFGRIGRGLSKSLLLNGIQCPKALWLRKNPPDFEFPSNPARDQKFRQGTMVGILAQQLFPGGTEVPYEGLSVAAQIARTRELIDAGTEVIYEASFAFDGIFVKVDILVRDGETWQVHEVKMSTSVKPVNLNDVAIQYYVLANSGIDLSRVFLVHIDNSYVRLGAIDVQQLFAGVDVTEAALARQAELPALVDELRAVLLGDEPAIDIGPQCRDPYDCDFISYCWREVPENSIFDLAGRGIDKWGFYRRGIVRLEDLNPEDLNEAQRFQLIATLQYLDSTDVEAVGAFLDTLWQPLCHLDFETYATPIPPFDGMRPYQKIPFQYSLHIEREAGTEPIHCEFLAEPGIDPRRTLAEKLLTEIPGGACILTYNQAFEKSVLWDLSAAFPDLATELEAHIANIRDLMPPFRRREVYRWPMRGSYSIKAVLPALVPDLSYTGLEIGEGAMASLAYTEMCDTGDPDRVAEIRRALLEYCRLDTLGMVRILEALRGMVKDD